MIKRKYLERKIPFILKSFGQIIIEKSKDQLFDFIFSYSRLTILQYRE